MKRTRPSPSSASSSQLQIWTPEKKDRDRSRTMDLAIVPCSDDSSTLFTLPAGWIVETRRRSSGVMRGCIDKYYIDPITGKKLRSLVSVKRYLSDPGRYEINRRGDIKPRFENEQLFLTMPGYDTGSKSSSSTRQSLKPRSLFSSSFKQHNQIAVYRKTYIPKNQVYIDRSKPLKLPQGWYIKRITRRSGHSEGRVDKYYCERATGRVFRSRLDVQRYLADNELEEENTTLSQLFKPAGLIKMSSSEGKYGDNETAMTIVSHSDDRDSYSDISDDVPLKDLVQKDDDVPLKDLIRKSDGVPLKDLGRKSDDVPLKDLVRKPDDVHLKGLLQNLDDVPIKDLVRKSSDAGKTSKSSSTLGCPNKYVLSSTTNTLSANNVSNPPMKIKWVLTGPGGDTWSPFMGDTMVPESLKEEWMQMFIDIVNQKHTNPSSPDALD